MSILNVYDVEFCYIAFQCSIPSGCRMFLFDNEVCLIGADGVMYRVTESSLNTKLNGLIEKLLFHVAIGWVYLSSSHRMSKFYRIHYKID